MRLCSKKSEDHLFSFVIVDREDSDRCPHTIREYAFTQSRKGARVRKELNRFAKLGVRCAFAVKKVKIIYFLLLVDREDSDRCPHTIREYAFTQSRKGARVRKEFNRFAKLGVRCAFAVKKVKIIYFLLLVDREDSDRCPHTIREYAFTQSRKGARVRKEFNRFAKLGVRCAFAVKKVKIIYFLLLVDREDSDRGHTPFVNTLYTESQGRKGSQRI